MKRATTILITVLAAFGAFGQNITGKWIGILQVQGIQLHLVFNISKSDSGYISTMDSPDQGANGIAVTKTIFQGSKLKMEIANAGIEYTGDFRDDTIAGTFKQSGQEFPLNLSKNANGIEKVRRPQEPIKPYPYYTEDLTFQNSKDNITLAGTLTLPRKEGTFPAVILITGSGPQNRDEEIFSHKPFLVISDYLTKMGIAVLRYDDRGIAQSTGNFKTATTADFANDVKSAIAYLKTRKEIDKNKIGLVGHSEGGIIAPIVAAGSTDVNFIVLLAGTGIPGYRILLMQQDLIARASGVSDANVKKSAFLNARLFEMIVKSNDEAKLKMDLANCIREELQKDTTAKIPGGMTEDQFIAGQVNEISTPWMQYFIKFDPATTLEKVKCPVLALDGEKDLQVPPEENLAAIKNALQKGGNKKITVKEFPGLNHLFQQCKTGLPLEYGTIEQTISPVVLEEMASWIIAQTK